MIYAHEIIFNNRSLIQAGITQGMKMDEIVCKLTTSIQAFDAAFKLGCIDYKDLGINECDIPCDSPSSKICAVINKLISRTTTVEKALATLDKTVKDLLKQLKPAGETGTPIIGSGIVKARPDDDAPKTLSEKLLSSQPDTIKYDTDKKALVLYGFIPIGGIIMMDAAIAANKFDVTGLGKPDTDAALFAICNGQNGTKNRLGRFPRWATSIATAGQTGGKSSVTITKENIESLDLALQATLGKALSPQENVAAEVGVVTINSGAGGVGGLFGDVEVITLNGGNRSSQTLNMTLNLEHTHALQADAKFVNSNPKGFDLLPLYIDELPIQRIK